MYSNKFITEYLHFVRKRLVENAVERTYFIPITFWTFIMSKKLYKVSEVVKLFEDDDDEAFRILKQGYSSSEASSSESEGISENDSHGSLSSDEDYLICIPDTPQKQTKTLKT